jgi:phenylacetaldehyde dehydrogenase
VKWLEKRPVLDGASGELERWQMLIDGEWQDASTGETFETFDPGRAAAIARVADGNSADVDRAVAAARRAFDDGRWSRLPAARRAEVLWTVADLLDEHAEALGRLEALNQGMPLRSAIADSLPSVARCFRYYAGWADKIQGTSSDLDKGGRDIHAYSLKEPVGVTALIIPWNAPLSMAAWKLAPALAAGCACVLKPAEETPLTALCLGEIMLNAGVPPGVVNVVTGRGETAGAPLAAHDDVDKVAFTGSTEIGKRIISAAIGNLKKVSLELGGKSPVIVCADADLERAIPGAAWAIFSNAGQVCTAGSRLFVHHSIAGDLIDGLEEIARDIQVGYSMEPDSEMGPLVSAKQHAAVTGYVNSAREEGAEVRDAGSLPDQGYFVRPTLLVGAQPDMRAVREEIFGPVTAIMTFDETDDALRRANATPYGLAASVWTESMSTAHRLSRGLRAGRVGINVHGYPDVTMPTGGYKQSGWGRELGREGLDNFLETKSLFMGA